jgi:acetyl esterase/lipase
MTSDAAGAAPALPPYVREVFPTRGAWRRRWIGLFLRWTAKRQMVADLDVARFRGTQAAFDAKFAAVAPDLRRTPVDAGGAVAEWIDVDGSRPDRVLLYLHGGAFILRFPNTHAGLAGRCCRPLGARALMVDYRLAPEHPFPAGLDDCHAAYRWLLAQGIPASAVVLGGDSAGGNLALALLHRLKADGEPLPVCAVLLSPLVDFTLSSASLVTNERRDPVFTLRAMVSMRQLYAPPERFLDPGVSPLFGDFAGLPPLMFQAGSTEMLLDESLRAAARAHAASVPVEVEVWDRMPHVFAALATLPQSADACASIVRFIARHTGWQR